MPKHKLVELLIKHEGLKLKPYTCSAGKLTIGVGRNLDDVGITKEEALYLLAADIYRVEKEAITNFAWYVFISQARQDVVLSMIFNLGLEGFKQFKNLISALENQNYGMAAEEMLNSKWASQVGQRAKDLSQMMYSGSYSF